MQNKQFVKVVIWIVVVSMVLGLGFTGVRSAHMKLEAGDPALLIDSKGRRFLLELTPGRTFQYHEGAVAHDDIIGRDGTGSWIVSSTGAQLLLLRPRLADFTLKMKRSAQVVYPKDLGPILVYADIAPGMTVLEAGSGSGALTRAEPGRRADREGGQRGVEG